MRRQVEQNIVNQRRGRGTTIGALLLISLAAVLLLTDGNSGGAGPAAGGGKGAVRGEIVPVEQTRTLYAEAFLDDGGPEYCDIHEEDAAEGFEDYDNTIVADCYMSKGEASQHSYITSMFLSADGYAYGKGVSGGGHWGDGSGESIFEVVFDSSATQWCTLSGVISIDSFENMASGFTEVVLTGPGEVVLFEARLEVWADTLPFSGEFLLSEGGQYTLRAVGEAASSDVYSIRCEYSVLLELEEEVPANDVGVLAINNPPAEVPAGACTVNLTIANYGSEDQEVPVHCEVLEADAIFLDEDFDGSFPPPGWYQEQDGEWQLHEGNEAGGAAPEAWLEGDNITGDYACLDSAHVDTTSAGRLVLEFKHRLVAVYEGGLARVLTRSSSQDEWTIVGSWLTPPPLAIGPEYVRIDISHDIGPATQVRFEYDSEAWLLNDWYLNDVRLYDLSTVYAADASVSVAAIDTAEVQFDPQWQAPEGFFLLDAATELPGDEHPENDDLTMMLSVEPFTQYEEQKLTASDGEEWDWFGIAVAIEDHWAIVGASADDNGNGISAGAAYVYRFDGSAWIEQQRLLASDGAKDDRFGGSVAISGDVALVGAADNDNQNGKDAGAAYVFRRDGSTWYEDAKLLASDGAGDDTFGAGLDLDGDLAIIGSPRDNDSGASSGSVHIYRFDGSQWVEEQKLLASDAAAYDKFGGRSEIHGDLAVVGARGDDNENGADAGAAYVFRRDGSTWQEEAKLLASDGAEEDSFGRDVAIDGERIVVGASKDDDLGADCGAAYVFRCEQGAWIEEAKLLATDGWVDQEFGTSIAIEGDVLVVGAYGALAQGYGNGGSAYLFARQGSDWTQTERLLASDVEEKDYLGHSVAISGRSILVGARGDNDNTGAVYVFAGPIAGDIDGDVDAADLLALLAAWGPCEDCPEDINGNGVVNTADLLILLGNWG